MDRIYNEAALVLSLWHANFFLSNVLKIGCGLGKLFSNFRFLKNAVVPPIPPPSPVCGFSWPWSTEVWKYYMENSRNKQFINLKSPVILHCGDMNHSFVQYPCCICCITDCGSIAVLVFKLHSFYLIMAPKWNSATGNWICPNRSYKVLPLSEKMRVWLNKERKKNLKIKYWGC